MQDISNVPILPNIKRRIEEELGKSAGTRDQDFLEHMFGNKSSVYDVLYAKGKCFWMRVYEIRRK
jgi:hypothetical protein